MTVASVTFGQTTQTDKKTAEKCDGILGLGWPSYPKTAKTFMESIVEQKKLDKNMIGMYLKR